MLKITPSFIHLHDVIIRVFLLKTSLEHNLIETYIAGESTWSMMLIIIHSQGNFRDSIILLKNGFEHLTIILPSSLRFHKDYHEIYDLVILLVEPYLMLACVGVIYQVKWWSMYY